MKVTINIEKRYALTITALLLIIAGLVVVIGYNTPNSNPSVFGHTSNEIDFIGNITIENAQAGNYFTGRLSTQSIPQNCPNGWVCGVHTWDAYADASVRAKYLHITSGAETPGYPGDDIGDSTVPGKICLGTVNNQDPDKCISSWDEVRGGGTGGTISLTNCAWESDLENQICPGGKVMVGYDTTNGGDRGKRYCCNLEIS